MKKPNKITLIISLFVIVACVNFKNQTDLIKVNDFSSKEWKQDSLGCNKKRSILVKSLVDNKNQLISHKKREIESLLGKPNHQSESTYFYFVASGLQCSSSKRTGFDSIEVKKLLISFEKEKVKDVYTILP